MEKTNGLEIKSFRDWMAIATVLATLLAMYASVVRWGLKLESELNVVRDRQAIIRQQVGNGILPRAEERLNAHERRLRQLEESER